MPEKKNPEAKHGKQPNQKLKPYLVLQYLLKYSDENHTVSAPELVAYLQEQCGIYAERRSIYRDIEEINKAMLIVEDEITAAEAEEQLTDEDTDRQQEGQKHIPEKISFKYLKYAISDMTKQAERRVGAKYTVSPYSLLINDGNYYLLAYDDYSQDLRTYRVDRMKDVKLTGIAREGAEAFSEIDLKTYSQRVFGMFGGQQDRVQMRFINPLLDAVVDRFGTKGISYSKADETHFYVVAPVEVSDQYFSWICQFGKKAKIMMPERVVKQFKNYLDRIRELR